LKADLKKESHLQPIRVLIADDHARSRRGLRALLATSPAIEVVGEASNGQEAVQLAETCCPDTILMDARMPVMSGLQAAKLIKSRWPEIKVLVMTLSKTELLHQDRGEIDALLVKGGPVERLWAAILSTDV